MNFLEAVVRWSSFWLARGKSGHLRAGFPVKTGGACSDAGSRQVQQKANRLPTKARVKWWGKSPPPQRQLCGQGKPNPMQGEIGNGVVRSMVSGTSHLQILEDSQVRIDK